MEISQQINSVIDNLSNKLQVPATKLLEVYTGQAYVTMYIDIITLISLCIATGLSIYLLVKSSKYKTRYGNFDQPVFIIVSGVATLVSILLLVGGLIEGVEEIITCKYNPQYWAIRKITNDIIPHQQKGLNGKP